MIEKQLTLLNALGLHARAAARLVSLAITFNSDITLLRDDISANGKSILSVLTLASGRDSVVTVRADGDDEVDALDSIAALFANKFGETE